MNAILLELNRAASIGIAGLVAMAIVWVALAVWAEPYYRAEALKNQEQIKW